MKTKKQLKRIRNGQLYILLVLVGVFLLVVIPPTHAQEITITNSADLSERDINVYYPNFTTGQMDMLGRYNTTSVIETNGSVSYTFDLVPVNINPLTDPGDWMTNIAFPFISSNVVALIVLIYLITKRG